MRDIAKIIDMYEEKGLAEDANLHVLIAAKMAETLAYHSIATGGVQGEEIVIKLSGQQITIPITSTDVMGSLRGFLLAVIGYSTGELEFETEVD